MEPAKTFVSGDGGPPPDIIDEARRIGAAADAGGVLLRPVDGVAVRLHVRGAMQPALERFYRGIDLVAPRKSAREVPESARASSDS